MSAFMQLNDISMQFPSISVLQHEKWLWNHVHGSDIDFTTANETAKSSILAEDPQVRPHSGVYRTQPRTVPPNHRVSAMPTATAAEAQKAVWISTAMTSRVASQWHHTVTPRWSHTNHALIRHYSRARSAHRGNPALTSRKKNITAASAWRHGWKAWLPRTAAPQGPNSPTAPCRVPAHLRSSTAPQGGHPPCPGRAAWGRRTSLRHQGAPSPAERWRHHPATQPCFPRRNGSAGGARRSAVPPTATAVASPAPSPTAPLS